MSKRTFNLCTACIGGASTIASGFVTFFQPPYAAAIVTSVGIAATAAIEILTLFTKSE